MNDKMSERLCKVRKHIGMSQREFAKKIGISQPALAMFETGDRDLKNIHIIRICEEFGVNEVWFRTGDGGDDNMFTKLSEDDRFSLNLGKLSTTENEFIKNGINFLAETDPEKLKVLEDFMKSWLGIK